MKFWLVTIVDSITGNRDLIDPTWIVATFGGGSESEILRQIEEAKESVGLSPNGPPPSHMEGKEFFVENLEFNAMGVARM